MQFAVTVVSPPGYPHSAAFHEVAESLHYALRSMGHESVMTREGRLSGRRHIVLGSNLLPHYRLPLAPDAILYNLEQVVDGSSWVTPELLALFKRHVVWDYSEQNARALASLGVGVHKIVPVGFVPELSRIVPAASRDIDVLFVGSIVPRRRLVLERMRDRGLNVVAAFGLYGRERDALIARARLLLNLHAFETSVLEMVRLSYLLANGCAVLSERSADATEDGALAHAVAFCDYDQLPARALDLVNCEAERARLSRFGLEAMKARRTAIYLHAALAEP